MEGWNIAWSHKYERPLATLIRLQDELPIKVALPGGVLLHTRRPR